VKNNTASIEDSIRKFGLQLLELARNQASDIPAWMTSLISQATNNPDFRVQALRFIDALPALHDDAELVAHLKDYFEAQQLPWPAFSEWGLQHSDAPWAVHIAAPLVRASLRGLSRRFMGGRNARQVLATTSKLHRRGMSYTLDFLGEAVLSEIEADHYQQAYIQLLKELGQVTRRNPATPSPHISIKLSSLYSQINPADPVGSVSAIAKRLRPILRMARDTGAAVTIDMEQYDIKHIVMQCFMSVMQETEFRNWPDAGIAIQTYLKDAREDLLVLLDWVEQRATPVHVRIVRGAYWDYENVIARLHGWEIPVWEDKAQTDACFEDCLELLFSRADSVKPAVASHNVRSLACAMALAECRGVSAEDFEFQMLYGMADELKQALVTLGYRLRVYVPFGETLPGMAYLVRRLLENSSGQTILDTGMAPELAMTSLEKTQPTTKPAESCSNGRFRNLAVHRFTRPEERESFAQAILAVRDRLGEYYPLTIGNEAITGSDWVTSLNPSRPAEIIGRVARGDRALADQALVTAQDALADWGSQPGGYRSAWLRKIAAALTRERNRFAAWQVLEAGKNWAEADADVCEAVDFLNYYAEEAERLAAPHVTELGGEHNQIYHRGKGVGLVIAPWNFPLAILTGMLSATIVSGNTAIIKPSSLTPVIAAQFMQLLQNEGLPPGVVNFLPGSGSDIGEYLASSPLVNIIAFTGSRQVGTRLIGVGAQVASSQRHVKRVIAEMGGKNAIIVDADADLDDAVSGIVRSAFGYQGQKCSAASRVIVVGSLYDALVERLAAATESLAIGDPQQPGHFMGPVIDAEAYARIKNVIAQGKQRAQLLTSNATQLPSDGYYITPHIFTGLSPDDSLAQEEIFGPVLVVLRADDFEEALRIANSTAYALTGGVYSRRPAHLVQARATFQVGNLYLNRAITGALVSRQPFGGFRLSGTGSKAGGRDYLLQFTDPVCVTENTLRRGFAPGTSRDED
jgi:RHH-type proline utilization regulon transcriptional repressor/proline dehydrogenase/delta 1-pyrroline-5-carboxylate dehydrogenase